MSLGALTQAWVTVEASLPLGWQLEGVMSGTVYLMACVAETAGHLPGSAAEWVALASGPDDEVNAIGEGDTPQRALLNLAKKLEPLRGDPNG